MSLFDLCDCRDDPVSLGDFYKFGALREDGHSGRGLDRILDWWGYSLIFFFHKIVFSDRVIIVGEIVTEKGPMDCWDRYRNIDEIIARIKLTVSTEFVSWSLKLFLWNFSRTLVEKKNEYETEEIEIKDRGERERKIYRNPFAEGSFEKAKKTWLP